MKQTIFWLFKDVRVFFPNSFVIVTVFSLYGCVLFIDDVLIPHRLAIAS